jgi:hypothetical protein
MNHAQPHIGAEVTRARLGASGTRYLNLDFRPGAKSSHAPLLRQTGERRHSAGAYLSRASASFFVQIGHQATNHVANLRPASNFVVRFLHDASAPSMSRQP